MQASLRTPALWDDRVCELGEGPFWHPLRQQLFWFDILGRKLLTRDKGGPRGWSFGEDVSAGGWIDHDTVVIAGATGLFAFELDTGARAPLARIEADAPMVRSNDGKTDPWGGFWVGTQGKLDRDGLGAYYRYHRGSMRSLMAPVSISNALAFAPDGSLAYLSDTPTGKIWQWRLDPGDGWPLGEPDLFADLSGEGLKPDGAACDAGGTLWVACWGAGQVLGLNSAGRPAGRIECPARFTNCPAFGGPDLRTMFLTSAVRGARNLDPAPEPQAGRTFAVEMDVPGVPIGAFAP